jgi:hypothetical protein
MAVSLLAMRNLFFIIIFSLLNCLTLAQQSPPLAPVKLSDYADAKPARCESRTSILDGLHQKTPADQSIIVIAHLGNGETRPNLNWRRLYNVRAYWSEYLYEGREGYRRNPQTIILAEGEKVNGYGYLEFYVGGKLVAVIKVARNADVDFGDCYPPNDSLIRNKVYNPCLVKSHQVFYPCRDRNIRRKGNR